MSELHRRMDAARAAQHERLARERREKDRAALVENLCRKIQTSAVGAISAFEERFGHLWGQGVPHDRLTPEQVEFAQAWGEVREMIFDLLNRQIRNARAELALHEIEFVGQTFQVKKRNPE